MAAGGAPALQVVRPDGGSNPQPWLRRPMFCLGRKRPLPFCRHLGNTSEAANYEQIHAYELGTQKSNNAESKPLRDSSYALQQSSGPNLGSLLLHCQRDRRSGRAGGKQNVESCAHTSEVAFAHHSSSAPILRNFAFRIP